MTLHYIQSVHLIALCEGLTNIKVIIQLKSCLTAMVNIHFQWTEKICLAIA